MKAQFFIEFANDFRVFLTNKWTEDLAIKKNKRDVGITNKRHLGPYGMIRANRLKPCCGFLVLKPISVSD